MKNNKNAKFYHPANLASLLPTNPIKIIIGAVGKLNIIATTNKVENFPEFKKLLFGFTKFEVLDNQIF